MDRLLCRRRQISNQPQRNRQLFQLEVRTQERYSTITTWLPRYFRNIDPRLSQRSPCLGFDRRSVIRNNVTSNPAIQECLSLGAGHEASDLVTHHGLQVMREP